jgi:hypothetical protein
MRSRSTQRALGSMLMAFEAFVVFFATLVAFGLDKENGPAIWTTGLLLAFALIITPAILGRKGSYIFGWVLQALVLLTGIQVPLMWFLGAVFICLWAWAMIAGSTIDKARAVLDRQHAEAVN